MHVCKKYFLIVELNYCEENTNTCENGGKCTSLIKADGNFKCECPSGYRGKRCQILPPMMMTTSTTVPPMNTTTVVTQSSIAMEESDIFSGDDIDNEA